MKGWKNLAFWAVAMVAIFGVVGFVGCGDSGGGSGSDPDLEGTITISPNTDVETGTELTATYSGGESVSYQWKKGSSNVGTDSNKYIPTEAGSYTVTVSAVGYKSKTSTAVTVTVPTVFTVTFNSNGGTTVADITNVTSGATITKPTAPTKAETIVNVFIGWYKEVGLVNAWDFASDTVTGNITLYAKWDFEYAIGDTGPGGGKIFYRSETGFTMTDDNSTAHYLEAATDDMATTLAWASSSFTSTSITGTSETIGAGKKNTALILETDISAPAAKACRDYNSGGKTDWFLPSRDELNQLYINRAFAGNNFVTEEHNYYWSSWEFVNGSEAWVQSFSDGNQNLTTVKFGTCLVRAVRAF